ncbi:MAG: transketolase [Acidobacteria bacterium]|nr:transketolase [Acidobacteriota bacterium]MBI3488634.1 transketolase [Acidobacteriota bacterium]
MNNLDKRCIDTIRCLAMDAVQKANSGHPGTPMAQAPAAYALWAQVMKHNPANPHWPDRDRFVLSCGHASMLIYSLLFLAGYGLELDDLKAFRQWGSRTPGHPEFGHTAGIETTTGPLGQGIGNAVGMAIAERWLAGRFNRPGHDIVNHRTFAFAGDGCLMEGVAYEAASLAGHLGLGKLTVLWDNNRITIEGRTDLAWSENVPGRFEAMGWRVLKVADGEDLEALLKAFREPACGRPTLIDCTTVIGFPAPSKKDTHHAHGAPLGDAEIRATKEILGFDPDVQFPVPAEALAHWRGQCGPRGAAAEAEWRARFEAYRQAFPELAAEYEAFMKGELPPEWRKALPTFSTSDSYATREASGKVLNALAAAIPNLIGGSADLAPSNNTHLKDGGDFGPRENGRNFHFGIREHAMGAVLNGMSLHGGLKPFSATFFIFCDYMRPTARLASLMKIPVTYVWTHDSIGVGEDGPTHQPIEQMMSMRLIPGFTMIRPADANETAQAWAIAVAKKDGPVGLALTRQKLPTLDATKAEGAAKGAYILEEASAAPRLLLLASGSEVHLAVRARKALEAEGVPTRVVSMPCWELFEAQSAAYRAEVLPEAVTARVSIEAGVTTGWQRYTGAKGACIGLDHFGASAPADILFEQFGLTVDHVVKAARALLA